MMRRMKIVLSHIWALWWWRTSDPTTRIADHLCAVRNLDDCKDGMGLLKAAGLETLRDRGIARGIPLDVPLDLVTNARVGHQSSSLCVRHQGSGEVPPGALSAIGDGTYVFTPCFCLLQIASIVTKRFSKTLNTSLCVVIIAELACELCGQYSLAADGKPLVKRQPLVTTGQIAQLALTMKGSYGVNLLWAALPWVVENLRSPKETDVFLLLCLPARLGGFGLPAPVSNYDIDVSNVRTGFFLTWRVCNVDFFWGFARLIVEYDSREHHEDQGQKKVERDKARADALRALGYTVVTIFHDDLYSPVRFRAKAEEIAAALGTCLPDMTDAFRAANTTLRQMLLLHDRWI